MIFADDLMEAAYGLVAAAEARDRMIVTAESCTGGLLAACLTEIPGASAVLERGFVTYSNAAKHELLGVPEATIAAHGAVSAETARAMAEGALAASRAHLAVSVTGIAGPGGGAANKPVGLVCFGLAMRGGETSSAERRFGDIGRTAIRLAAVKTALTLLRGALDGGG